MLTAISIFAIHLTSTLAAPQSASWTIEGEQRSGIVYTGTQKPGPTVFVFHGHGGTARNSARSMAFHTAWPEATIVYLQGLPTSTSRDPKGERPGWQNNSGLYKDRDLKLVDHVLSELVKNGTTDPKKVFASGHSNGARFTYLLWATRNEKFAGFAPCAAHGAGLQSKLKPANIFMIAGEKDAIVPYETQKSGIDFVRTMMEVSKPIKTNEFLFEKGKDGKSVGVYVHDGGHNYPKQAVPQIVKFFQSCAP